jgi:predicted DNA binding CopG/RHH family protein
MKHKDGLTDQEYTELQALAEKYDKRARKDTAINMRVSSDLLDEIKACAKAEGYPRYQTWLTMALEVMVAEKQTKSTKPI